MLSEKQYSIAIRKRKEISDRFYKNDDFKFFQIDIDIKQKYWIADPFLFKKNGITYIFYELYDLIAKKGYIAYSVLLDNLKATKPKIVIKDICHLSFPFIFEYKEHIYIMPESCNEGKVKIFIATSFPDKWKEETTIIDDCFSVDSIIFRNNNALYLMCSEQYYNAPNNKINSCWVKNILYKLNDNFSVNGYGKVISEGEHGIRNAGNVFFDDTNIIRPGQICDNGEYGKGLAFFKLDNDFNDLKVEYEIDYQEFQKHINYIGKEHEIIGVHTYNYSEDFEIIDFSYIKKIGIEIIISRKIVNLFNRIKRVSSYIIQMFKKIVQKVLLKVFKEETYISKINNLDKWAFISYIADSFYHRNDMEYLNIHQNKKEAIAMCEVINKLGYNAYFMLLTAKKKLPKINAEIVFGQDPNFERACKEYKNAKKIFYNTSTYYKYRNFEIKKSTDEFNNKNNSNLPYRRLVNENNSINIAEKILLIGSDETVNTFPNEYRYKITKIHQSIQETRNVNYLEANMNNNYFYLGSNGNIFKGLGILIEYFSKHKNLTLHVVAPIERDFYEVLKNKITNNIKLYGYHNIKSNVVYDIVKKCDYVIYPSFVEGVPGSVLVSMKMGLIPLVSPCASFDEIEKVGYKMKNVSLKEINKAIKWSQEFNKEEVFNKKRDCISFVENNYNINNFKKEFNDFFINNVL